MILEQSRHVLDGLGAKRFKSFNEISVIKFSENPNFLAIFFEKFNLLTHVRSVE